MDTVLGLIGILLWIVAVITLAAGVTYGVIRVSPGGRSANKPEQPSSPSS